jgi:hypothetical protein
LKRFTHEGVVFEKIGTVGDEVSAEVTYYNEMARLRVEGSH